MTYRYHDLDWRPWYHLSGCRARFRAFGYRGRCELRRHHDLDRGPDVATPGQVAVECFACLARLSVPQP